MALVKNVELVHDARQLDAYGITPEEVDDIAHWLNERNPEQATPLRTLSRECDRHLGFTAGTSLKVVYHLIATRRWQIDMNCLIEPGQPLIWQEIGQGNPR